MKLSVTSSLLHCRPRTKNKALFWQGLRKRGFTLVELVVALAVVGILAALAAPAMRQFVVNGRLRTATADLSADLAYARAEAVRRGQRVSLCAAPVSQAVLNHLSTVVCADAASTDWSSGWILFADPTGTPGLIDAGDEVLRVRQPVAVTDVLVQVQPIADVASGFLQFRPNGAADAVHTWQLQGIGSGHRTRQISVQATGRLQCSYVDSGQACNQ